ncbi:MAG: 5-formyltetrahydrofolate cyclo-ligase [Chromatiaceae bacterium]|nr:5-formyltetrahydrofolate cyclo-ligase [Chromatiaceae bacterium]
MTPTSVLRRRLREARRALSPAEQRGHSHAIARLLGREAAFLRAHRVGAYWSANGEIDPFPLLRLARMRHKQCFLPVLRPHPQKKLWFLEYSPGDPLERNQFGIPEPQLRNRRIRLPWALDLLLVPLVGFDADCNRMGMGGGYYDRTLAYLRRHRYWHRPLLVGIAHECQRTAALKSNPWDVPLDMVATEERIYLNNTARA